MAKFKPEAINIRTALDDQGSFLGIDRIVGESLKDFKRRLLEVNINLASSTYMGLINGITRELGLTQQRAFRVELKAIETNNVSSGTVSLTKRVLTDSSKTFAADSLIGLGLEINKNIYKIIANTSTAIQVASGDLRKFDGYSGSYRVVAYNPFIKIDGNALYLYRDYFSEANAKLDAKIPIRHTNTFISDIAAAVNNSTYFSATSIVDSSDTIFAKTLERQQSIITVPNENIPSARNFKLEHNRLIESSIRFSEGAVFKAESTEDLVSSQLGNYYVDTGEGFVIVNGIPSGRGTASYMYSKIPFDVVYSPIVINNFKDDAAQEFLFSQKEQKLYSSEADKFTTALPGPDMTEFIFELLNVTPLFWGE